MKKKKLEEMRARRKDKMFMDDVNSFMPAFLDSFNKFKHKYDYFYAPFEENVEPIKIKPKQIPKKLSRTSSRQCIHRGHNK